MFKGGHDVGDSVVYIDDDSDNVSAAAPEYLKNLIQQEASNSAQWLKGNRLCVADNKSNILVIGTKKLRDSKLPCYHCC